MTIAISLLFSIFSRNKITASLLLALFSGLSVLFANPNHWSQTLQHLQQQVSQTSAPDLRCELYESMSDLCARHGEGKQQMAYSDSCLWYAQLSQSPLLLVKGLHARGRALVNIDSLHLALKQYNQAHSLSQQHPTLRNESAYLSLCIDRLRLLRNFHQLSAQEVAEQLLAIYQEAQKGADAELQVMALKDLVGNYRSRNQLDRAIHYNDLLFDVARQSNDNVALAKAKITDIDIYFNLLTRPLPSVQLEQMIAKCTAAYQFTLDANLPIYQPWPLLYGSKFYRYAGQYDRARTNLDPIEEEKAETRVLFSKYDLLTEIEWDAGNREKMYAHAQQTRQYALQARHTFFQLKAHNNLLDYFITQEFPDSTAFYAQQIEEGLGKVDTSFYLEVVAHSYELLSKYYKDRQLPRALDLLETANGLQKKHNRLQQEAIADIAQYRQHLASLEGERHELSENTRTLSHLNWFLLIVALLLAIGSSIWYRRSKTLQLRQTQLEQTQAAAEAKVEKLNSKVQKKHLILNNKTKIYLEELTHIKSDGNYLEFHLSEEKLLDRNRLKKVAEQLPPNFVQVHRSYIINRNFIKTQQANLLILEPDVQVPISRTYKAQLLQ